MNPPLYVHPLMPQEHRQVEATWRSSHVCRVRRAPIGLASARGPSATPLAPLLGCSVHTIRHVIHAFNVGGLRGVAKRSTRPQRATPTLDTAPGEQRRHLRHPSRRRVGMPTGRWTLACAAQVGYEPGLTARPLRDAPIRRAMQQLGAHGKRAQPWLTSPAPQSTRTTQPGIA
jgi:hypothetical protein